MAGGFRRVKIYGNEHLSAAAFLRAGFVPFVGEKMFQCGQQKRTEPSARFVGVGEIILFEQAREKFLREVLRVGRRMAQPPHISIKRMPISLAEPGQRVARPRGVVASGGDHHRPVRRDKRGLADHVSGGGRLRVNFFRWCRCCSRSKSAGRAVLCTPRVYQILHFRTTARTE